jgi:hypothetical protein
MSTFQARFYENRYAIGRLVIEKANSLGIRRRQLVERLGFSGRLAKGHRVLSEILLTGTVPEYVTTLADALEIDELVLNEVLYATTRQQEAERQARLLVREEIYCDQFRPHLQIKTERSVPSPIFIAAMLTAERLRIAYLPKEINSVGEDERREIVRESIQRHYRETGGEVPAFGRIEGYYFVRFAGFGADNFGVPYDVEGSPIGDMIAIRRVPEAGLGTKRGDSRLTGLLKNDPFEIDPIREISYDDIDLSDPSR